MQHPPLPLAEYVLASISFHLRFNIMNKTFFIPALLALLIATGCARREDDAATEVTADTDTTAQQSQETFEKTVPKATIAPVDVNISLTPAAEAALKAKSEKILAVATYAGDPIASEQAQAMTNAFGMIPLGESKITLDGAGKITFNEDVIDASRKEFILGEVQLTINVLSAKTATSDNLLACPFYWKTLAEASKDNIQIQCKALSEVEQ